MSVTAEKIAAPRRRRIDEREAVYACGWCKAFVHWENRGGMFRMVHDERPATEHEVLPYRIGR